MKYKARVTANPKIRPIRVGANGRHYFILYADPALFRDLKNDSDRSRRPSARSTSRWKTTACSRAAIFSGTASSSRKSTKCIDELATPFTNVGSGGTVEVGCAFLCGAQAVGRLMPSAGVTQRRTSTTATSAAWRSRASTASGRCCSASTPAVDTGDLKDHGCRHRLFRDRRTELARRGFVHDPRRAREGGGAGPPPFSNRRYRDALPRPPVCHEADAGKT